MWILGSLSKDNGGGKKNDHQGGNALTFSQILPTYY